MDETTERLMLQTMDDLRAKIKDLEEAGKTKRPGWATAAPQGPLTEIKGRCVVCQRVVAITTDDPTKGPKGFRWECQCWEETDPQPEDHTTWHARLDYDASKPIEKTKAELAAERQRARLNASEPSAKPAVREAV